LKIYPGQLGLCGDGSPRIKMGKEFPGHVGYETFCLRPVAEDKGAKKKRKNGDQLFKSRDRRKAGRLQKGMERQYGGVCYEEVP